MKLTYKVNEKAPFGKNLVYAFQQLLAILAATVLVPVLVNGNSGTNYLNQASALIGAGVGTLVYLLFTKFKSPVFLGSSFAFISPLIAGVAFGYLGVILGALFAGLVYVIIAIVVSKVGTGWINKLMPPVIIGPTVALIGLSLSGSAINNVMNISVSTANYNLIHIAIAIITFLTTVLASVKGTKGMKLIPFIIGVGAGYIVASILTVVGYHLLDNAYFKIIDFSVFAQVVDFKNWIPDITLIGAIKEIISGNVLVTGTGVISILLAFAPVALVVFAEHVADHKNISSIIEHDLLEDPGLHRTLLGDGVGSIAGALMGGCPNTTYGESVGCVAITGNASVYTIFTTAIMCIILAFIYPIMLLIQSIPGCVVGGISIALYGFIAVSGLRMFKHVDLDDSKNLFIVAAILVTGLGGLVLNFGGTFEAPVIQISSIACALILGIVVNLMLRPTKVEVKKEIILEEGKEVENNMFGTEIKDKEE
ncbi:MAG: uracil-xanthine permease [Clostridia bacterium]|nr:uracil-xanthine permease [Clostridia bacterium]